MEQQLTHKQMAEIIGKRLVKLRGVRTRTGVARELGVGYNSLGNYEKGIRIPPDDVKVRIAQYYGIDVYELFFSFD